MTGRNDVSMLISRPLHAQKKGDVADLQQLIDAAPAYSYLTKGRPPLPADAEDVFHDLPASLFSKDKLVAGFMFNDQMVGVVGV